MDTPHLNQFLSLLLKQNLKMMVSHSAHTSTCTCTCLSQINYFSGVVLSSMISVEPGALPPYLVVLDAKTWNEVGRAEFDCSDMHKDLHGLFVPY